MTATDPRYSKRWRLDRARGQTRLVEAEEARTHLVRLLARGATTRGVAEMAGCSPSTLCKILDGQTAVRRETLCRVLGVTITSLASRPNPAGFVPAEGSRRRVRGLLAMGWRHQDITDVMLRHGSRARPSIVLHQRGNLVSRSTADALAAAYDTLAMTPGPSKATRSRALRMGYLPPLAWDDDTIDDPSALAADDGLGAVG